MVFLKLFLVFTKIGIFNFGGGYAMLSLIQSEVVIKHNWMTMSEFTDIVAVSQMTPGPIGINAATYVGYTAVMNDPAGYPTWMGILGAIIASLSVVWLPFLLMVGISHYMFKHKNAQWIKDVFSALRPAIVGLIAAAALLLMTKDNFGSITDSTYVFWCSIILFCFAFVGTRLFKVNPILMIVLCGLAGLIIY